MSLRCRVWLIVWLIWVCVWLVSHACPLSVSAETSAPPPSSNTPAAPEACPPAPDPSQRVILQSDTLEYFDQEKRIVATGNVTVTYGDKRLLADQLELRTDTNTGTALGHVRLISPDDRLEASRLDFDLTSERGVLYDSAGQVAGVYRIAGERIERLGPRTVTVQRGRVTTCTSAVPEWEFRAVEAHIGLGDYVTLKQPSFWIKGIPVFYVPYFVFPIKDKRTTGFLPPHVGLSERFGQIIGGEYFWAMTDWMDSTFGLEYLSKVGLKPEVEFRYALDPESDGQLNGAFVHDKTTNANLWRVLLQQRQDFGWGIRGVSQIDVRSDSDIVRRFARTTITAEEAAIRTASYAALTTLYANGGVTLVGASYDGIPASGTTEQFRLIPELRFSQFPTALPGGLRFALDTSYARLSTTTVLNNTPVQRLELFPRLTVPVIVPPWVGLAVTAGVHETLYDHSLTGADWVSRRVPDLLAVLDGPAWRRRYNSPVAGQALIHVLATRIAYRYVPVVRQNDVPAFFALDEERHFIDPLENFPLVDRIRAANYAKLSLLNRFYAQGLQSAGTRSVREVAYLNVSQGLDMRQATEGNGQLAGPLDIDLALRLWPHWWLDSTLRLAPATGSLQEALWRVGLTPWPGWGLTLTHFQRQDPAIHYLQGGLFLMPLTGLQLAYSVRYDARAEAFREHTVTLRYQAVCYRVDVVLHTRKAGDTNVALRVNLLNL